MYDMWLGRECIDGLMEGMYHIWLHDGSTYECCSYYSYLCIHNYMDICFSLQFYKALHFFFSTYEGEVLKGKRHGQGVFRCKKSVLSYSGDWCMGKRHGKVWIWSPYEKVVIIYLFSKNLCPHLYKNLMLVTYIVNDFFCLEHAWLIK